MYAEQHMAFVVNSRFGRVYILRTFTFKKACTETYNTFSLVYDRKYYSALETIVRRTAVLAR